MKHHTPQTQDTKAGTSDSLLNAVESKEPSFATPQDINAFLTEVAALPPLQKGEELHELEVPRRVIEHYNRSAKAMAGFDEAGYFIFQGVKVFEKGKKHTRDTETIEHRLFEKKQ